VSIFSELRTRRGHLPGFGGATGWLNSEPLEDADLRGNVVLVDFWTYTCINWLRTLPYVRAWSDKYSDHGLVVIGVHTPEFPFERDEDNVRRAVRDMAVEYPVALDPEYAVWQAFANHYWPAAYFADAEGRIRHHQFGEGNYEECERVIQRLLRASGRDNAPDELVDVVPDGIEAQADWSNLRSPETYLNEPPTGGEPDGLRLNEWSLSGNWTVEDRASVLNEANGTLGRRFHARDVHLVLSPRPCDASVPFQVRIDGEPPGDSHGLDVDEQGNGSVSEQRLYQLVRQRGPIADRTLEITFLAAGAEAYVFTFG
jgi:thiol-disulfide isomerase/thioredoxin